MLKFRTVKKLSILEPDILIIKLNPVRKIIYLALGLGLTAAFFIGFKRSINSTGNSIQGIVIYIIITLIFISFSAFSRNYVINRKTKKLIRRMNLISIDMADRVLLRFKPDNIALNLIGIPLFDNYPMDKTAALRQNNLSSKKGSRSSIFKRRFMLYRLYIDNPDTRIKLFETTDHKEAQRMSDTIGGFLGIEVFESSW